MKFLKIIASLTLIYFGLMVVIFGYLGGPGLEEAVDHRFVGQCFRTLVDLDIHKYRIVSPDEDRFTHMDLPDRFFSNTQNNGNLLESIQNQIVPAGTHARLSHVYTYFNRTTGIPLTYYVLKTSLDGSEDSIFVYEDYDLDCKEKGDCFSNFNVFTPESCSPSR